MQRSFKCTSRYDPRKRIMVPVITWIEDDYGGTSTTETIRPLEHFNRPKRKLPPKRKLARRPIEKVRDRHWRWETFSVPRRMSYGENE